MTTSYLFSTRAGLQVSSFSPTQGQYNIVQHDIRICTSKGEQVCAVMITRDANGLYEIFPYLGKETIILNELNTMDGMAFTGVIKELEASFFLAIT